MAVIEQKVFDELTRLAEEVGGENADSSRYAMELLERANGTSSRDEQSEAIKSACIHLRVMDLPEEWFAKVAKLARNLQEYADALANLAQAYRNCRM